MQTPAPPPRDDLRADRTDGVGARTDDELGPALSAELAVAIYEHMVLVRAFDRRLVALQREGRVSYHASAIGEEGVVVGAAAAMADEDWIFPSARETAAALWRGMSLGACAHHAFGSPRAIGGGRGAPGVPFARAARIASVSALSATQIPHAVGFAWAARSRGSAVAALVFFGDGATSAGDFHAALNFAGVTRAPLVAVCRNNGWATSTPASQQTASEGFAAKAVAYGIARSRVDGSDVVAVVEAVREARARAIAGEGATLIEAVTASVRSGHPAGDADVDDDGAVVVEPPSEHDPITRFRAYIEARGLWNADHEERLREDVRGDVERAVAQAEDGGRGAAQVRLGPGLFDDVYARRPWHLVEQAAQAERQGGVEAASDARAHRPQELR